MRVTTNVLTSHRRSAREGFDKKEGRIWGGCIRNRRFIRYDVLAGSREVRPSASTDCVAPAPADFIDSSMAERAFVTVNDFVCPFSEHLFVKIYFGT